MLFKDLLRESKSKYKARYEEIPGLLSTLRSIKQIDNCHLEIIQRGNQIVLDAPKYVHDKIKNLFSLQENYDENYLEEKNNFYYAIQNNNYEMAKKAIENGYDPKKDLFVLDKILEQGESRMKILKLAVEEGIEITLSNLDLACQLWMDKVLDYLLQKSKIILDKKKSDKLIRTIERFYKSGIEKIKTIEVLMKHGAEIDMNKLLEDALDMYDWGLCIFAIKKGADLNILFNPLQFRKVSKDKEVQEIIFTKYPEYIKYIENPDPDLSKQHSQKVFMGKFL